MGEIFQEHLPSATSDTYEIRDCRLSRIRHRPADRCLLQYTVDLAERSTGRQRCQWVSGALYAQPGRALRMWRKLLAQEPVRAVPESLRTLQPVSFIPALDMLVQVFPYDRRLPSLPSLVAGPPPALERLLMEQLGRGDWRAKAWRVEPLRYREQLGAVLRYRLRGHAVATAGEVERRFYVKVYRDVEQGNSAYRALQTLREYAARPGAGFNVPRPIAYLEELHAVVLAEAPGVPFDLVLLREQGVAETARRVARALAAFNSSEGPKGPQYLAREHAETVGRTARLLRWACPQLQPDLEAIRYGITPGLEGVPFGPTHRDLKLDHIFIEGERVIFVDLDSFASADPVLDPAVLLARLAAAPHLLPVPRERVRAAASAFADEYFGHVPSAWRARLPALYAGALLDAAAGFFRRQEPFWPETVVELVAEARAALNGKSQ